MRGFLWVKTLSTCWTGDGGAICVVTFLEASPVETHLGLTVEVLPVAWRDGLVQVASLNGVANLVRWRPKSCWWPGGVTWMLVLAACSGLRRLALLGNCQCGVGLRRRAALAAPISWDGLACSGLRRVAQPCSATPVWYIIEWRRKRQLGLLVWQRWLLRGCRNAMRSSGGHDSVV